jgi:4-hydroxy-3-methylbut-2-enyl diphosphate reductase
MLHLNVTIDQDSGFCFGVVYAIEMAEDILREEGKLFCLGDIVHNDEEVKRLENMGLVIISHEELANISNEKVLIRAHGEPASTYEIALKNDIELIDASCPVVLKLQNRIKNAHDKKENIFIYGKHGHAEVIGLKAQTSDQAVVFQDLEELNVAELPNEITLFSQTTKSTSNFYEISETLNKAGIKVNTNDTICRQVSNRDKLLKSFAVKFDKIIFVSGTKSSNGKVLYNICKSVNTDTHFISSSCELDKGWFNKNDTIGICGATSTPMWLMEEVRDTLLTF